MTGPASAFAHNSHREPAAAAQANLRDQYIPVRKSDILGRLLQDEPAEHREVMRELYRLLGAIYHYRYFATLERLREDYFYFNPELEVPGKLTEEELEALYRDLLTSFLDVMRSANFIEVDDQEIEAAHNSRAVLRVEVEAPLDHFREVHMFRRGEHMETFKVPAWLGWRTRKIETMVYDDIVLLVAMKSKRNLETMKGLRREVMRKLRPDCVMIKYFRNIASADLNALFPEVRVRMSTLDKVILGVPALIGGVPLIMKLWPTMAVMGLVIGFYLGLVSRVDDDHMKAAIATLTGFVAVGAFIMRQFVKWQRQTLKYQKELTDNVYFRNVNNNAGIFDYIIGAAEEQDCKEAFLAYHFLRKAAEPLDLEGVDRAVERWISEQFGVDIDFEAADAIKKLEELGLLRRSADGLLHVVPIEAALAQLDRVWDGFFSYQAPEPRDRMAAHG